MSEVDYEAWAKNAISFIHEKELWDEFVGWVGGWPCPIEASPERMLAAAADLYEALQRLVNLHVSEQEGISSGMPSPEKWMCAVDAAADALAKARGETKETT